MGLEELKRISERGKERCSMKMAVLFVDVVAVLKVWEMLC